MPEMQQPVVNGLAKAPLHGNLTFAEHQFPARLRTTIFCTQFSGKNKRELQTENTHCLLTSDRELYATSLP